MCIQQPPIGMNVYKWWATYGYQYPALKQLARDTFVAMGSSVPSKSAFSESGQLVTPQHARLSNNNIEMLMKISAWKELER